ncbi:MAG TPA: DUF664 domain-containing protein [Candidatus Eisenbacteria bacterium]|jgi:uncharacterized damage-inducible protein DinB|nr:DUF664 domain-containing protein [Candidatus Eisenbacteria bacterium]
MTEVVRLPMKPLAGFKSLEAGSFMAQLDDQLERLREATRGLTPEDLMWQPEPGMNTIGMLLAHLAVVEVWWTMFVIEGKTETTDEDFRGVLGIGADDDGLPLAEKAPPFPLLDGKDLAFYDNLLDRARNYFKRVTKDRTEEDMERTFQRTRPDGTIRERNVRWFYYHILEHFAGHFGQILLLRHLLRARTGERALR